MAFEPLDPFSEVVDERRRWTREWYSWLLELVGFTNDHEERLDALETAIDTFAYSIGTWTPAFTFATPGDLAVTYSAQVGNWTRTGRLVTIQFVVSTTAFSHTTASGALIITGLPFNTRAGNNQDTSGSLRFSGITKAGYTQFVLVGASANTTLLGLASGSGVTSAFINAADMPSGGTPELICTMTYTTNDP